MTLGEYLSVHSIQQREFAAKIHVSAGAVSHWILGIRTPRPATIKKIIKVTSGAVKAEDFLPDFEQIEAAE